MAMNYIWDIMLQYISSNVSHSLPWQTSICSEPARMNGLLGLRLLQSLYGGKQASSHLGYRSGQQVKD